MWAGPVASAGWGHTVTFLSRLFQPSFTSSSVTSGSCSSTSDSVTMTTWNTGETPQHHTQATRGSAARLPPGPLCSQDGTRSTATPGEIPPLTTIATATRATQTRGSGSESSTT